MAACERCWSMSRGDPDEYRRLLKEQTCTPEQQAGPERTECRRCGRDAVHQYARVCMVCNELQSARDAFARDAGGGE